MQRLDAIGVVAAELQDVIARPGEVPDVQPLEDHLPIDEREEAIDLRPGLDERADVVVEAGPHALAQRRRADPAQRLRELPVALLPERILDANVPGYGPPLGRQLRRD